MYNTVFLRTHVCRISYRVRAEGRAEITKTVLWKVYEPATKRNQLLVIQVNIANLAKIKLHYSNKKCISLYGKFVRTSKMMANINIKLKLI